MSALATAYIVFFEDYGWVIEYSRFMNGDMLFYYLAPDLKIWTSDIERAAIFDTEEEAENTLDSLHYDNV